MVDNYEVIHPTDLDADRTSVSEWLANTGGNLVTDQRREFGLMRRYTDTGALDTGVGSTTNSTYHRTLTVEPGSEHHGFAGVGPKLKRGSAGHTFHIRELNFVFDGLEIEMDNVSQGASDEGIRTTVGSGTKRCDIKNAIIHGGTVTQMDGVYSANGGHQTYLENVVIYNMARGGVHQQTGTDGSHFYCKNVTAYDCGDSINGPGLREQGSFIVLQSGSSTNEVWMECINCVAGMRGSFGNGFNRWANASGTLQSGSAYRGHHNTSSDGTAAIDGDGDGMFVSGSTNLLDDTSFSDTTEASAAIFESLTLGSEDFRLVNHTNNVLIGSGDDLSITFTTDFLGAVRSVPWDQGAHEVSLFVLGRTWFGPRSLQQAGPRVRGVAGPTASAATGTVAGTLGAITGSAAGAEALTGTVVGTLAAITGSAVGTQGTFGTVAGTLAPITGSAVGAEKLTGVIAGTLGAITGSAVGEQPFTGVIVGTLAPVTGSAVGEEHLTGVIVGTLAPVTGSAVGEQPFTGVVVGTLAPVTGSAAGAEKLTGVVAGTLGAITGSASGAEKLTGVVAGTLGAITGSATGNQPGAGSTGVVVGILAAVTGSAAGAEALTGVEAGTLAPVTGSASGAEKLTGVVSGTLGAITGSASGLQQVIGVGAGTLAAITGSAAGAEALTGTVAGTLGAVTVSASGGMSSSGVVAGTLAAITGAAVGSGGGFLFGTVVGTLPSITGSASGSPGLTIAPSAPAGLRTVINTIDRLVNPVTYLTLNRSGDRVVEGVNVQIVDTALRAFLVDPTIPLTVPPGLTVVMEELPLRVTLRDNAYAVALEGEPKVICHGSSNAEADEAEY